MGCVRLKSVINVNKDVFISILLVNIFNSLIRIEWIKHNKMKYVFSTINVTEIEGRKYTFHISI